MYIFLLLLSIVSMSLGGLKCPDGWKLVNKQCYSSLNNPRYIADALDICNAMDPPAYVMVLNTKQEMFDIIRDGVVDDGEYLLLGAHSLDNGTTWTYADGSTDSYLASLPLEDESLGEGDHIHCTVNDDEDAGCSFMDILEPGSYICETQAVSPPVPCDVPLHKKLHRGSTRKITLNNDENRACYYEIQRGLFKPAQVKIYGYKFETDSSTCDTGFLIQTSGDAIEDEPIEPEKLTCGKKSGYGKSIIKKRSKRGGIVRIYFVMNGKGGKVGMRAKGRSFI